MSGISTPRAGHTQTSTLAPTETKSEQKQNRVYFEFDDMDMDEYCTDFSESDDVHSLASSDSSALLLELSDGSASESEDDNQRDDKDTLVTITLPGPSEDANSSVTMEVDHSTESTTKDCATVSIQAVERESQVPTPVVQDGAHRTWRALVLYLYNDRVAFAPLRTEGRDHMHVDGQACSPKSMYRLADKVRRFRMGWAPHGYNKFSLSLGWRSLGNKPRQPCERTCRQRTSCMNSFQISHGVTPKS